MIEELMIHPFPDLRLMLMLIWMHSFDQAFWCCNADMLLWRLYLFGLFMSYVIVNVICFFPVFKT
jgi:hypothetical protein